MKGIVLLFIFPLLTFAAYVKWSPTVKISGNSNTKRFSAVHHSSATDVTHIFWEELGDDKDYHLFYRTRLATGQLTEKIQIGADCPLTEFLNQLSVQATDDGMHILIAYGGYRKASNKGCTKRNDASCIETYFAESFNGGKSWTLPAKVNRTDNYDIIHRSMPSMALEKDTGRVYITYLYDMNSAMEMRNPGDILFNPEEKLTIYTFSMTMNMGYTISKQDNKRYLHLVWYENDIERTRTIRYARSEDGGKTWTKGIDLVKRYNGESVPNLAIDTDSAEGGVYVQYSEGQIVYILWSKDHGKNWEEKITIGKTLMPYTAISICGKNNKGRIFSMNHGRAPVAGTMAYIEANSRDLSYVSYPFNGVKDAKNFALHCNQKKGQYILAAAILDTTTNEILLAHGTIIE